MEKINIAELLKDCPKGMELDCVMFDNVTLVEVDFDNCDYPISISVSGERHNLSRYGEWFEDINAKCVIFPKGKNTWEGFVPPCEFKDGDIVCTILNSIAIIKEESGAYYTVYCGVMEHNVLYFPSTVTPMRLATEEEKQKLFDAIKDNGYRWNAEKKCLEKLIVPKFKVGDKVKEIKGNRKGTIINISGNSFYEINRTEGFSHVNIADQDEWELVPDKFDITTLKPFDKVLVRDSDKSRWCCDFFSHYIGSDFDFAFNCVGYNYGQCIPYKGNEHLLGTTTDCSEYYKTWEE